MSLTSYRAAPPRGVVLCVLRERVLIRSGGDLLSRVLGRSTISGGALNFRVRDGIGCFAPSMATRPDQDLGRAAFFVWGGASCNIRCVPSQGSDLGLCMTSRVLCGGCSSLSVTGSDQAYWTISTGQLSALLRVHLRPIDVVVCHGPQGDLVLRGASRLDAFSGYPVRS